MIKLVFECDTLEYAHNVIDAVDALVTPGERAELAAAVDSTAAPAAVTVQKADQPGITGAPPPPALAVVPPATDTDETPDFDADGIPWDVRIHSATPTLTVRGTWRGKRGVDKAAAAAIKSELQAANAQTTLPLEPGAVAIALPVAEVPAPAVAAVAPPPPATPPPAVADPAVANSVELASKLVAGAGTAGEDVARELHGLLVGAGLGNGTADLVANPQFCPWVDQEVKRIATERGIPLA